MDVVYISALSALAGSVISGLTSGVTTWLNQRSLARAGQLAHELSRRQELYKDFIVAASKLVESFLFGMKRNDPWALGMAVAILFAAALVAGYVPARRASSIDPMVALRNE